MSLIELVVTLHKLMNIKVYIPPRSMGNIIKAEKIGKLISLHTQQGYGKISLS